MARGRGRGRGGHKFGKNRRKNAREENLPKRRQYEEFGEAHPIDEREIRVKRLKVEDTEDIPRSFVQDEDSEDSSSDEEESGGDAVSRLLATFNTDTRKAVDSDEEEEEEEEDIQEDDPAEEVLNGSNGCEESDEVNGDDNDEEESNDGSEEEDSSDQENSIDDENGDTESRDEKEVASSSDESDEDEDLAQDQQDPFSRHFERNLSESSAEQVKDTTKWTSTFEMWPALGRVKLEAPSVEVQPSKLLLLAEENEESIPPSIGEAPQPPNKKNYNLQDYHIKKTLQEKIPFANENGSAECDTSLTEVQKELLCMLSNYSDLYYPKATFEHWEEVRVVYAVHALNHVLKTRKRIMNHNAKIKAREEKRSGTTSAPCRDQGYTRPKVLILLPFKHSAFRVVETMTTLLFGDKAANVQNQSRFREEYGPGEEEQEQEVRARLNRAEDFTAMFTGDTNEDFKIGLKVTKSSLKVYADFYQSDIILASPLGLRYIMGTSNRTDNQIDFLTSIEVLILDQADIFMMQNWEHILVLMDVINRPPRDVHKLNPDLTRVRLWSLDGHAPLYRQTLLFSSTTVDHHRALITKCTNFTSRLQVLNPVESGSVTKVVVQADLLLTLIPGTRDPDARFQYFTQEVLPQFQSGKRYQTMVYVPDYCDYVRLLRHLKEDGGTSIASINEYMVGQNSKVAKARSLFFEGKRHFLLYTERFHFYRRYRIKGVRHVIFYELPTYPHFFTEICNLMVEGNQNPRTRQQHLRSSTVTVLLQRSDLTRLVGVLGSRRAADVLGSNKAVHMCVIGR